MSEAGHCKSSLFACSWVLALIQQQQVLVRISWGQAEANPSDHVQIRWWFWPKNTLGESHWAEESGSQSLLL